MLVLALYPLAMLCVPLIVFRLEGMKPGEFRELLKPTEEEKARAVRLSVLVPLGVHIVLVACTLAWLLVSPHDWDLFGRASTGVWPAAWAGVYIGLGWSGIWWWIWFAFSRGKRFRRSIPGLGASHKSN